MLMIPTPAVPTRNGYPDTDPKAMPGTEWRRILMFLLIDMLLEHFKAQPRVCVSGDILVFYRKGDKRKHVSPDVFFVRDVEKRERRNYLVWGGEACAGGGDRADLEDHAQGGHGEQDGALPRRAEGA